MCPGIITGSRKQDAAWEGQIWDGRALRVSDTHQGQRAPGRRRFRLWLYSFGQAGVTAKSALVCADLCAILQI